MTRVQMRWWWALVLAEIGVLVALDLVSGGASNYTSAMAVAPLTAAAAMSPPATAAVAVAAMAAGAGLLGHDRPGSAEAAVRILVLVASSALAVAVARQRRGRDLRLADATRLAAAAQRVLLRPVPEQLASYQLAARYRSAAVASALGGDFFDVAFHPSGAVVALIGDVQGKGLDAVETAAAVLAAFRAAVFASQSLTEVVRTVDTVVSPDLGPENFVTMLAAWLTPDGRLETANLGHPDPLIVDAEGITAIEPALRTTPLGLGPEVAPDLTVLRPGATLLGYTDGISEARNNRGEFFPIQDAVKPCSRRPPGACLDHLMAAVANHAEGVLTDDLALLAISFQPARRPSQLTAASEGE